LRHAVISEPSRSSAVVEMLFDPASQLGVPFEFWKIGKFFFPLQKRLFGKRIMKPECDGLRYFAPFEVRQITAIASKDFVAGRFCFHGKLYIASDER
jgi:hypothetical protein